MWVLCWVLLLGLGRVESLSFYRYQGHQRISGGVPRRVPRNLPLLRAQCPDLAEGPCLYISCRHHLAVDRITSKGKIKWHPDFDPDDLESLENLQFGGCSLEAAEVGGMTLEQTAQVLGGMTRERVRQIEVEALAKVGKRVSRS